MLEIEFPWVENLISSSCIRIVSQPNTTILFPGSYFENIHTSAKKQDEYDLKSVFAFRPHNCQASGKTDSQKGKRTVREQDSCVLLLRNMRFSTVHLFFSLFDMQWIALTKKDINKIVRVGPKKRSCPESASGELLSSNVWFLFHIFFHFIISFVSNR